jgi:hypothetical protein
MHRLTDVTVRPLIVFAHVNQPNRLVSRKQPA